MQSGELGLWKYSPLNYQTAMKLYSESKVQKPNRTYTQNFTFSTAWLQNMLIDCCLLLLIIILWGMYQHGTSVP